MENVFVSLPSDGPTLKAVKDMAAKKVSPALRYIVLIGIGGSENGTKAVYDALYGYFDIVSPDRYPKIIFMDTTDPEFAIVLSHLLDSIKMPQEMLFVSASKSGETLETVTNTQVVSSKLFGNKSFNDRLVVITSGNSPLADYAKQTGVDVLEMPQDLSGRFSVFSAIGLFPLLAAGVDIDALRKGAQKADQAEAVGSAKIVFDYYSKSFTNYEIFFFHPELESLGKWYRQLIAESLGKGGKGITPLVAIGSNDLHSMLQLRLDGPKNVFTSFVCTESINKPSDQESKVLKALYDSAISAYQKASLPFAESPMADISPYSLGRFMQTKMYEIVELAKMMDVNPFDQPAVNAYKIEAESRLS